jgi:hypothetical protein
MIAEIIGAVSLEVGIVDFVKSLRDLNQDEKNLVYRLQAQNVVNILIMNEKWMDYLRETHEDFSEAVLKYIEMSSLYKDYVESKLKVDAAKVGHRLEVEIDIEVRGARSKMKAAFSRIEMLFKKGDKQFGKIREKVDDIKQATQNTPPNWQTHCEKHLEDIKELIITELERTWLRITRYNVFASLVLTNEKDIYKQVDDLLDYAANKMKEKEERNQG